MAEEKTKEPTNQNDVEITRIKKDASVRVDLAMIWPHWLVLMMNVIWAAVVTACMFMITHIER